MRNIQIYNNNIEIGYISDKDDTIIELYRNTKIKSLYHLIKNTSTKELNYSTIFFKYHDIVKQYGDIKDDCVFHSDLDSIFCNSKIQVIKELMRGYYISDNINRLFSINVKNHLPVIINKIRIVSVKMNSSELMYLIPNKCLDIVDPSCFGSLFIILFFCGNPHMTWVYFDELSNLINS